MSSSAASSDPVPGQSSSRPTSSADIPEGTQRPSGRAGAPSSAARAPPPPPPPQPPQQDEEAYDDVVDLSDGPDADVLNGLRQSAEYKAAWDMELWKAVQAERFRQQLERQRARAMADLARSVKQKEQDAVEAVERRSAALTAKEAKLERELRAVAQAEARLAERERGVRRMRQQLLDAQRRVEDEVRAQVRRANDDITHKALMLQDRVKAAEAQAQRAEERQRQAQSDYLELYEEFHRFRTQQLTTGGGSGQRAAAEEGERVAAEILKLRTEHQEEMRLLREGLEQRHRQELDDVLRRNRELEEQNRRLTGALARRREQLRNIRGGGAEAGTDGDASSRNGPKVRGDEQTLPPQQSRLSWSPAEVTKELDRLRRERTHLVEESAGAIGEQDSIVRRLDARIVQLSAMLVDIA